MKLGVSGEASALADSGRILMVTGSLFRVQSHSFPVTCTLVKHMVNSVLVFLLAQHIHGMKSW